jgi:tRNA/rRNA methyltransferase
MTLPKTSTGDCARLRFILVETSRAGNIGAAARAMKTMGFSDLVLVRPREADPTGHPEAIAFASGAQDLLQSARIVDTIEEALDGCNFAAAVSARLREFSPPVITPRVLAAQLARDHAAGNGVRAALVFGNERAGLPNDIVQTCNVLINIPANPAYSSLNLAQAVQILAYECALGSAQDMREAEAGGAKAGAKAEAGRDAGEDAGRDAGKDAGRDAGKDAGRDAGADEHPDSTPAAEPHASPITDGLATIAQIEAMYQHLEQALAAIGFLDPANPRRLMSRLRRLFSRTSLETEEVNILRGIARQMQEKRRS